MPSAIFRVFSYFCTVKHTLRIVALALAALCLCACGGRRYPSVLDVADSLAEERPDSACRLLASLRADTAGWSVDARVRYTLVGLKASSYAYRTVRSDSLAAALVGYCEDGGDGELLPAAYYYAGKIYRELNEARRAASCFISAIKSARAAGDLSIESRAYSQLGYAYSEGGMHDKAIEMFKGASRASALAKDTASLVFDLRDIANNFSKKYTLDSALHYFKIALRLATKQGNAKMSATVHTQIAALYERLGMSDSAWSHLSPAIKFADPHDASAVTIVSALLYDKQRAVDSAKACYMRVTDVGTVYAKQAAHTWLAEYYSGRGDTKEAVRHLKLSEAYADSVEKSNVAVELNREIKDYRYNELKELNAQHEDSINGLRIFAFVLCVLLLLAALFVLSMKKRHKKGKANLAPAGNARLELATIACGQDAGIGDVGVKGLEAETPQHGADVLCAGTPTIEDAEIYRKILEKTKSSSVQPLTDEEWGELSAAIERACPGFLARLKGLCRISEADIRICLLIRAGFKLSDIAALVCLTPQGLASARKKLYNRAFGKDGSAKAWDDVVRGL